MNLRAYTSLDLEAVARVYTDAVHQLAVAHYDEAQRRAWAPTEPDVSSWAQRLEKVRTLVADDGGQVAGFVAWDGGYVDLLFVSPSHARRGVATLLYAACEDAIRRANVLELTTHASEVAKPFFEKQGLAVVATEDVERDGQVLRRYAMRKGLR